MTAEFANRFPLDILPKSGKLILGQECARIDLSQLRGTAIPAIGA
jgi:hypothetical protein